MLLLVTIGLVVVGAVALVIGFVSNSLGPIYLSIACSVIAGVVLVVFSRMARRGDGGGAASIPASPGSWSPGAPPSTPAPAPSPTMTTTFAPPAPPAPAPVHRPEPEHVVAESAPAPTRVVPAPPAAATADDFPIEGYDALRASQIVELLGGLDIDELDMVQEREERTKNRATVLRRVAERIDLLEAEDGSEASPTAEPVTVVEDLPAAAEDEFLAAEGDDGFPIADYDSLSADEVIAVLDDLEDDELDMVAEREELGRNRIEILDYIDQMFEEVDGAEPPPARATPIVTASPAPARSAAKKSPTKKVPALAGKAPAKKAPARKASPAGAAAAKAPVKKAASSPATRAAAGRTAAPAPAKATTGRGSATKAAATKAPATKAPATKATAKKAPAKKAPAKKAAAPARKR